MSLLPAGAGSSPVGTESPLHNNPLLPLLLAEILTKDPSVTEAESEDVALENAYINYAHFKADVASLIISMFAQPLMSPGQPLVDPCNSSTLDEGIVHPLRLQLFRYNLLINSLPADNDADDDVDSQDLSAHLEQLWADCCDDQLGTSVGAKSQEPGLFSLATRDIAHTLVLWTAYVQQYAHKPVSEEQLLDVLSYGLRTVLLVDGSIHRAAPSVACGEESTTIKDFISGISTIAPQLSWAAQGQLDCNATLLQAICLIISLPASELVIPASHYRRRFHQHCAKQIKTRTGHYTALTEILRPLMSDLKINVVGPSSSHIVNSLYRSETLRNAVLHCGTPQHVQAAQRLLLTLVSVCQEAVPI